jgi:DNA-binding NarL/FixJ family response regulator
MSIRVVVVDDHALFRQGVTAAVGSQLDVVGEADDIDSGIEVIRRTKPAVVLLDVHLTSGSGIKIIEALADELPATRYLALSVSDAPADVLGLVRAGARGYVTKRIGGADLIDAVNKVAAGDAVFSPKLAGFVLDTFTTPAPLAADNDDEDEINRLSPREHEVMQHLARGYAYKEIAAELHISVRTVESHASAVLRKLQLTNRHELTHWAATRRLV